MKVTTAIIELVIVLAVTALILVGILVAVAGAQRSRRDAQRKNDASKIGADLEAAASNKSGCYPTQTVPGICTGLSNGRFKSDYTSRITTPDNTTYNPVTHDDSIYGACPAHLGLDHIKYGYSNGGLGRQWEVAVGLESGDAYCATSG